MILPPSLWPTPSPITNLGALPFLLLEGWDKQMPALFLLLLLPLPFPHQPAPFRPSNTRPEPPHPPPKKSPLPLADNYPPKAHNRTTPPERTPPQNPLTPPKSAQTMHKNASKNTRETPGKHHQINNMKGEKPEKTPPLPPPAFLMGLPPQNQPQIPAQILHSNPRSPPVSALCKNRGACRATFAPRCADPVRGGLRLWVNSFSRPTCW